jgi:uncharacterized protein (TIGR00255 family)
MTGFGRGARAGKKFRATVELRSVNGRFLEVRAKIPRALAFLEPSLRERLERRISRGVVDLTLTVQALEPSTTAHFDEKLARSYAEKATAFARDFGLTHGLTALALLKLPGVMSEDFASMEEDKEVPDIVGEALDEALENLINMRRSEGEKLARVLQREIDELASQRDWIQKHRGELNEKHGKRLQARVAEWMGKNGRSQIDESRLYQEVAYYLDRADVTEELDRLSSHLKQCEDTLYGTGSKSVGKRLEFLAQELGREVNTIGAKSDQAQMTARVVEMKLTLEKIREQVQNLE